MPGIDLEIIEKAHSDQLNVIVPSHVRINGIEVLLPQDSVIAVSDITTGGIVTVTMTMMVGSLSIRQEAPDA